VQKAEQNFWGGKGNLRDTLMTVPRTVLERIENGIGIGTGDVTGVMWGDDFWAELKALNESPAKPETVVKIPHYTQDQRNWIRGRGRAGGKVFLILKIGSGPKAEHFVFHWPAAYHQVGKVPLDQLRQCATVWTVGPKFPLDAFKTAFHMPSPPADTYDKSLPPSLTQV
jgi:hypothetical protein